MEDKQVSCHPTPKRTMVVALGSHRKPLWPLRRLFLLAFTTTTHFHHSFWLLSSFENFNQHSVAQTSPAQRPSNSCAVCRHWMYCCDASRTNPVLHPAHVYLAFSLKKKKGKKNLNLWIAASRESLCPRGSLPWSLNKNKYSWSFARYFSPHGNRNIIHTKRAFYI